MKRVPRHTYRTALRTKGVKAIPPYHALRSARTGDQVIDALAGRVRPIQPLPTAPEPLPTWAILLIGGIIAWFGAAIISAMGN